MPRRTASDKLLGDKAFNTAKNLEYDRYQWGLASVVWNILIKSLLLCMQFATCTGKGINSEKKQIDKELHKPSIRKF